MTAPTVPDRWIQPALFALKDCLCETLAAAPYTPVCFCCVQHSQGLPPMDRCDCECTFGGGEDPVVQGNGQAWVRLVQVFQEQTQINPRVCQSVLKADVQLGVYRCIEGVLDTSVDPPGLPTCEQLENDALLILADRAAMWRAVQCCTGVKALDPVIGNWVPIGPSGGCAGGVLTVTLSFIMP